MDLLERIIREILTESVSQDKVIDAIKKRYEVKISYSADDAPEGKGERMIQPVAYGTTTAGNPVIRAFQPNGDTKTKIPHWKMFRLDRIESWQPFKRRKFKEPPGMADAEGKFNPNGDNSMAQVFLVADFAGAEARYKRGGLERYNQTRQNATPFGKLKANINRSVKAKDALDTVKQNVSKEAPKNDNYWSDYDMALASASLQNNDNNVVSQTVEPIVKGYEDDPIEYDNEPLNYEYAQKNGPVYKDDNAETPDFDYVDDEVENDEIEDNEENI